MNIVKLLSLLAAMSPVSTVIADPLVTPEWIWHSLDRSVAQECSVQRTFDLPEPVAQATLRFAADFCRCRVFLNGELLADVDDFGPWPEIDVTSELRSGSNTLQLSAAASVDNSPTAVALELAVTLVSGKQIHVLTGPDWELAPSDDAPASASRTVAAFGHVDPHLWAPAARVTSFDDYTQWMQAGESGNGGDTVRFSVSPGFEIRRIRTAAADEGSWVSMAFDPQGRLTIAREDKGLLRMTLSPDGTAVDRVDTINDSLLECRGLLYAYDSLYANANNSKGLYRLTDTNGDDQFDDVKLLREFPGGVGHGRNDLALGPDGMIYSIHGDSVDVPRDNILDRTSPLRADRIKQETIEGHVIRTDRDGQHWELVCTGLRNPYGIDFNADGELFTYDADAEFDMGAPWYRPTRIDHLVSGADFGWRGRTGNWPPYTADHADNSLPAADVGKGSPTSVVSGRHGNFPAPWNDAMFALDWAYGRILACHLQPRGAGYVCRAETFVQGRPFNVTDLTFGPDGFMYVITGGRKTQSALYSIRYTGPVSEPVAKTRQQSERSQYSKQQRTIAAQLAKFHGRKDPLAIKTAWPYLGSSDPTLRHAAQVAIEHQPEPEWFQQAINEQRPEFAATSLMMLARNGERGMKAPILHRLSTIPPHSLSTYQQLSLLFAYSLCLTNSPDHEKLYKRASDHLLTWFPAKAKAYGPTGAGVGAGEGVNRLLAELLLLRLESTDAVSPAVNLLRGAVAQEDRLFYLFVLRHSKAGWSIGQPP
ncbi:MAG: hypothetical protein R3C19_03250 [Planctomycetaceae bacterium]